MSCVVRSPEEVVVSAGLTPESLTILLSNARQIDKMVSRWLVSTDLIERHDMEEQCENLISEVNAMIVKNTGLTPENREAIASFLTAERYYQRKCKQ